MAHAYKLSMYLSTLPERNLGIWTEHRTGRQNVKEGCEVVQKWWLDLFLFMVGLSDRFIERENIYILFAWTLRNIAATEIMVYLCKMY